MVDTAIEAGISPETLRKIESGRVAAPSFPTIGAIADALGLSLDDVWSATNEHPVDEAPFAERHRSQASVAS